jgi:hypothetical protein
VECALVCHFLFLSSLNLSLNSSVAFMKASFAISSALHSIIKRELCIRKYVTNLSVESLPIYQ